MIYKLKDLKNLYLNLKLPNLIFLKGDLGTGKTTLSKYILNILLGVKEEITSPTYTYYNSYFGKLGNKDFKIYHFDLYRLQNYDEFIAIGGEEILDNNDSIVIIEWAEILEGHYKPDIKIFLKNLGKEDERDIEIFYL